jgi:hypothetical protein
MSIDKNTRGMRVGRLLRLGVSGGERASAGDAALGELEMELALLREENARLKVERHRAPDAGRVIERMRHIGGERPAGSRDEAAGPGSSGGAMEDCLAIRDGLIVACQEVQQAMQGIRGRLGALSVDLQDGADESALLAPTATVVVVADAEQIEMDLLDGARVPSSLAQSAV